MIADGSVVTFDLGWVQSLAVQTAVVCNIQIAIGDNRITYDLKSGSIGINITQNKDTAVPCPYN